MDNGLPKDMGYIPQWPQQKGPQQCFGAANRELEEDGVQGNHMYQRNINAHGPIDVAFFEMIGYNARSVVQELDEFHRRVGVVGKLEMECMNCRYNGIERRKRFCCEEGIVCSIFVVLVMSDEHTWYIVMTRRQS